jgi:hypothetical protein
MHMPDTIAELSELPAKQALRALNLLYDLAPPEAWEGGIKPPPARVETIVRRMQEDAPEETQPVIDALLSNDNLEQRGELARYVLDQYAADERLRPAVERAVQLAAKPDMAVDPITITAIVAFMVLASPVVKTRRGTQYTGGLVAAIKALHVDKIAEQLPAIVKAIPQAILARLVPGH